jgi:hypothetical protein
MKRFFAKRIKYLYGDIVLIAVGKKLNLNEKSHNYVGTVNRYFRSGLPDFSLYNIPKWGKIYQITI